MDVLKKIFFEFFEREIEEEADSLLAGSPVRGSIP